MRRFFGSMGSVSQVVFENQAFKGNMLGVPQGRVVDGDGPAGRVVYVHAASVLDGRGLPLLVVLVGCTGSGLSHTNWVGFRENLPERLDPLIRGEPMAPGGVALPHCLPRPRG